MKENQTHCSPNRVGQYVLLHAPSEPCAAYDSTPSMSDLLQPLTLLLPAQGCGVLDCTFFGSNAQLPGNG